MIKHFFRRAVENIAVLIIAITTVVAPTYAATAETTTVYVVNKQKKLLLVSYNDPSNIKWGTNCTPVHSGAVVPVGKTCTATVTNDNVSTRFCAVLVDSLKIAKSTKLDCTNAQQATQTLVETIFQPSTEPGCFGKGSCVWFDISVIPASCTDVLWKQNRCGNAGGASYNLPVSLVCGKTTVYTCQGPQSTKYGAARYPSKCGDPSATTQGGTNGQNAYFYPMADPPENKYQPNYGCLAGAAMTINFLAGD